MFSFIKKIFTKEESNERSRPAVKPKDVELSMMAAKNGMVTEEKVADGFSPRTKAKEELIALIANEEAAMSSPISLKLLTDAVLTSCGHYYNREDLVGLNNCALCSKPLVSKDVAPDLLVVKLSNELVAELALKESLAASVVPFNIQAELQAYKRRAQERAMLFPDGKNVRFARYKELLELNELQVRFERLIKNLPPEIDELIKLNLPVLSSCGHYAESISMRCNHCFTAFDKTDLIPDEQIKTATKQLLHFQACALNQAQHALSVESLRVKLKTYPAEVTPFFMKFPRSEKANKARYAELLDVFIGSQKSTLKIDITNKQHLEYWNARTNHCWHGFGGVEVRLGVDVYRVPTRIHQMMLVVTAPYESKKQFSQALDSARSTKPTLFNKLFSCAMERDNSTASVYDADRVEALRL